MAGQYKRARQLSEDDKLQAARQAQRAAWKQEEEERQRQARRKAEEERREAERRLWYEKLETLDYELLALSGYPSDYEVKMARRTRMAWFIGLGITVFLFVSSLLSLVGPWVGGIAGGITFVLWLTHGAGLLNVLPGLTLYHELMAQRRQWKQRLLAYIRELEGDQGYLHRLYPLAQYNQRLKARKFRQLAMLSKDKALLANMKTLSDADLYHQFLVEARIAFRELQQREKEEALTQSMADLDNELTDVEADALPTTPTTTTTTPTTTTTTVDAAQES